MKAVSLPIALALLLAPAAALPQEPEKKPEPAPQQEPAKKPEATPPQEPAKTPDAAAQQEPAKAPDAAAQQQTTPTSGPFTKEQLEQLVAPIALYPDSLLAQILMGSTYPLEIVEAARWVAKNPKLKGDQLEAALKDQTWDPAVKALCGFADVVKRMNDNLDWTQDLGDAFLAQKSELMDAAQNMRRKAYDAGNLKTSKEMTVTEQPDKIIVIESAQPEVVYVPTYYPTAVYGSWSYPYWYYPPLYPPPPAGGVWFGFAAGVVWGAAIWGGCSWGWGNTDVDIDINKQNNFIDRTEVDARRQEVKNRAQGSDRAGTRDASSKRGFQHDPSHRKGVGYKDSKTGQKFGASPGQTRVSRDQARGYGDRSSRPSTGTRPSGGASQRPSATQRPSQTARPSQGTQRPQQNAAPRNTGQKSGSFSGSRSPSFDRAGSSRGASSRGSMGARGGGGGGGGGRGGRR